MCKGNSTGCVAKYMRFETRYRVSHILTGIYLIQIDNYWNLISSDNEFEFSSDNNGLHNFYFVKILNIALWEFA